MFDHQSAIDDLNILYKAASLHTGWHEEQTKTFIRVGGYALALDGIAYAYVSNHIPMPAHLYILFDKLATAMDLLGDPEFQGVADLRKSQTNLK